MYITFVGQDSEAVRMQANNTAGLLSMAYHPEKLLQLMSFHLFERTVINRPGQL